MSRVLHLFKGDHAAEAAAVIAAQLGAGDEVTVALLAGEAPAGLGHGARTLRVPAETPYERLVELIFASDHVVTW